MKEILKHTFLFLITLVVVYLLVFSVLFFIKPGGIPYIYRATQGNISNGGGTWIKFQKFDKKTKWDIIVLGSSHAYRGYDPEIFKEHGYKMYNLGTSNQHMLCTYEIAKNYINKDNCKMVILDMYDRVFSNDQIESHSDIIQNITDDQVAWYIAFRTHDIRSLNMITLRYFNKFLPPINTDTIGYVNGFKVNKKFLDPKTEKNKTTTWKYKSIPDQIAYLNKLLDYLQAEGIKVVAVEHPLPPLYTINNHQAFLADILPLFSKHHIQFLDYTYDEGFKNIRLFSDPTHLNHFGVRKFNERLITDFVKDNIFTAKIPGQSFVSGGGMITKHHKDNE